MAVIDRETIHLLFALLRSALLSEPLQEKERFSEDALPELLALSKGQDIAHLVALALDHSGLPQGAEFGYESIKAVYRYEQNHYEYEKACKALEAGKIPFLPLKGAVLREYYPQPWMRTSCDIDILVHREDLENAVSCLTEAGLYAQKERSAHDVTLLTGQGLHIELHFDLVEEGRASGANKILNTVWENVSLKNGYRYWYEMTDAFFYFYHIAHMAKHFESGGCGIRPFIDLWILDRMDGGDTGARAALLEKGGLLAFAKAARQLSRCWLENELLTETAQKMQEFILSGGLYGTSQNRVTLQQKRKGGRMGYLLSRMFVPHARLKQYYPVLEKHRWLTPVMQVRRWGMLLRPDVARMAKNELSANRRVDKEKSDEMDRFLQEIGL